MNLFASRPSVQRQQAGEGEEQNLTRQASAA
jgi:hypothetical protein